MIDISIIIPTYNSADTIIFTINSLISKTLSNRLEVILIDDCSTDRTIDILKNYAEKYNFVKLFTMESNNGTPSASRNLGIENAKGKYITFLDDDDTINLKNLFKCFDYAIKNNIDMLKPYLIVTKYGTESPANKIETYILKNLDIKKAIIKYTSTRIDILVKRDVLINNNIRFNTKFKLSEDTIFYSELFKLNIKIEYIDNYWYYYNTNYTPSSLSSTKVYGNKEILDHINAWEIVNTNLKHVDIDYFKLRLSTNIRNSLVSIQKYSMGKISENTFKVLCNFINKYKKYLTELNLNKRFALLHESILHCNYENFKQQSKKRLLIAGYDLKFIEPLFKYLEETYQIKVDKWQGHNYHDKNKSKELLDWADIIICEWLLGNAVWYSKNKRNEQGLIIRAHRFELSREFGFEVNFSNVDFLIAVGFHYMQLFKERFKISTEKMMLVSNFVENDIFENDKQIGYKTNIAISGILPKRKGYMRALQLLKLLIEEDKNFCLYVIGNKPTEVDWIVNQVDEINYYKECDEFIINNNLSSHVSYTGWVERSEMYNKIGYVLSLSDNDEPESFHLTVAEAISSGAISLALNWQGIEYIYPDNIIFKDINSIKDFILMSYKDQDVFNRFQKELKEYVESQFSVSKILPQLRNLIEISYNK